MMFFNEYCTFEINEILRIKRDAADYSTKKRNINTLSCRISGKAVFFYDRNEFATDTDSLLFIPKGTEYSQKTDGEEIIAVHLNLYEKNFGGIELFPVIHTMHCSEVFKILYYEWNKKNPGYRYRCTSILYELLSDIMKYKYSEKDTVDAKISNSVIFMKRNFANPHLTIAEIAKQSNISEIYFRKLWEKLYDETPGRYLSALRIKYAKSLLAGTDYAITEIAELAGFLNLKYFSTKFKKITGLTPSEYRNNNII